MAAGGFRRSSVLTRRAIVRYPDSPGFKFRRASNLATRRIAPRAGVREGVFAFLRANYPTAITVDEAADRLGVSFLSAGPRLSELRRSELIEPISERPKNESGMMARCLRAVLRLGGMVRDALKERGRA